MADLDSLMAPDSAQGNAGGKKQLASAQIQSNGQDPFSKLMSVDLDKPYQNRTVQPIKSAPPDPAALAAEQQAHDDIANAPRNFAYGIGMGLNGVMHAIPQLVMNSGAWLDKKIGGPRYLLDPNLLQDANKKYNAFLKREEDQYQADTPGSVVAGAGRVTGAVAPFLLGEGLPGAASQSASAVNAASNAPKVLSALGTAARGAGMGMAQSVLTQPVTSVNTDSDGTNDYFNQKLKQLGISAAVGAGLPAVTGGTNWLGNQVSALSKPFTNPGSLVAPLVQKAGEADPLSIASTLSQAPQYVPGSLPTTAQVLQTPSAAMIEKTVANTPAGKIAMIERQNANNAARRAYVKQLGGTDQELSNAIQTRATNAAPYRAQLVNSPNIDAQPVLDQLTQISNSADGQNPVVAQTLNYLRREIDNKSAKITVGGAPGSGIVNAQGNPIGAPAQPATTITTINPDILEGMRQNVSDTLRQFAPNGAVSTQEGAILGPLKNTIVDTIDSAVPGYRNYLATYAKDSAPINTMELFRSLDSHLDTRGLNSSGDNVLSLANVQGLVKKANNFEFPISSAGTDGLNNLLSDVQRESVSNSVRSPGSDTALNLQAPSWLSGQIYGKSLDGGGTGATGFGATLGGAIGYPFDHTLMAAGAGAAVGRKVSQAGADRVNNSLLDAVMNPDYSAQLMQDLYNNQAGTSGILQRLWARPPVPISALPPPESNSQQ
ncbi:MAG TPA: hypothetical protein VF450_26420 [Noviherbaspirillum sp.]